MFAITPTPWKQRHGNSDREQLLLYMCASSPINYMYIYAPWHVVPWIPVVLISHRCLGTVQYLCFCKLYSLICTMVAVAFGRKIFIHCIDFLIGKHSTSFFSFFSQSPTQLSVPYSYSYSHFPVCWFLY